MKELFHKIDQVNINKITSLNVHLTSNFYPPFPKVVKNRVLTIFAAYFRKRINENLLKQYLFKKFITKDGFYKYQFNEFLESEEK